MSNAPVFATDEEIDAIVVVLYPHIALGTMTEVTS